MRGRIREIVWEGLEPANRRKVPGRVATEPTVLPETGSQWTPETGLVRFLGTLTQAGSCCLLLPLAASCRPLAVASSRRCACAAAPLPLLPRARRFITTFQHYYLTLSERPRRNTTVTSYLKLSGSRDATPQ